MRYQVFSPAPVLAAHVQCYWTYESAAAGIVGSFSVVPDGCMNMIFHLGDSYRQYLADGRSIVQPRCFVIGQLTRPLWIEPLGQTRIFAVRFQPHGLLPFLPVGQPSSSSTRALARGGRMPLHALENTAVPLQRIFGVAGARLADEMLSADSMSSRLACMDRFLMRQSALHEPADHVVSAMVERVQEGAGLGSVADLTQTFMLSRRQLERRFAASTGLSPKRFARMVKLQAALRGLLARDGRRLTDLAHDGGYFDQSHFIRDFRALTGLTPGAFQESTVQRSLFYGMVRGN